MNFIFGLIIMSVGFLFVYKSEALLSNFGRIAFFEQKLGTEGGSRLGYKLLGLGIFFIGLMIFTNMIGGLVMWLFSPLLRYM